jgi:hypothetical protein
MGQTEVSAPVAGIPRLAGDETYEQNTRSGAGDFIRPCEQEPLENPIGTLVAEGVLFDADVALVVSYIAVEPW